jgi:hypothetical protein
MTKKPQVQHVAPFRKELPVNQEQTPVVEPVLVCDDCGSYRIRNEREFPQTQICRSCNKPFKDGDTCPRGGCPMGGDV